MEYASKGVAGTGLGLGIAGTALGLLDMAGGLTGLLGNRSTDPGDKPVTRYEMGLFQQINDKNIEISSLKSDRYTDAVAAGLQQQISGQLAWNATQNATLGALQGQISQLQSMTRIVVPNENVSPGWGRSAVMPVSSLPPYFAPYPFPPVSGTTTTPEAASSSSSGTGN
jgi:hypothetical protein